jgi:hypothetical protein
MPWIITSPSIGSVVEDANGTLWTNTGNGPGLLFPSVEAVLTGGPALWTITLVNLNSTTTGRTIQLEGLGPNGWYAMWEGNENDLPLPVNLLGLPFTEVRLRYILANGCEYVSEVGTTVPDPPDSCGTIDFAVGEPVIEDGLFTVAVTLSDQVGYPLGPCLISIDGGEAANGPVLVVGENILGPFALGQTVTITIVNAANSDCNIAIEPIVTECPVLVTNFEAITACNEGGDPPVALWGTAGTIEANPDFPPGSVTYTTPLATDPVACELVDGQWQCGPLEVEEDPGPMTITIESAINKDCEVVLGPFEPETCIGATLQFECSDGPRVFQLPPNASLNTIDGGSPTVIRIEFPALTDVIVMVLNTNVGVDLQEVFFGSVLGLVSDTYSSSQDVYLWPLLGPINPGLSTFIEFNFTRNTFGPDLPEDMAPIAFLVACNPEFNNTYVGIQDGEWDFDCESGQATLTTTLFTAEDFETDAFIRFSFDNGQTWTEPQVYPYGEEFQLGPFGLTQSVLIEISAVTLFPGETVRYYNYGQLDTTIAALNTCVCVPQSEDSAKVIDCIDQSQLPVDDPSYGSRYFVLLTDTGSVGPFPVPGAVQSTGSGWDYVGGLPSITGNVTGLGPISGVYWLFTSDDISAVPWSIGPLLVRNNDNSLGLSLVPADYVHILATSKPYKVQVNTPSGWVDVWVGDQQDLAQAAQDNTPIPISIPFGPFYGVRGIVQYDTCPIILSGQIEDEP